jgi:hypothetical protein
MADGEPANGPAKAQGFYELLETVFVRKQYSSMSINIPSPRDTLAGCMWLPRILAKARLHESGQLPTPYVERFCHPTGVDGQFIGFFKMSREDVLALSPLTDEAAAAGFCARPEGSPENIARWNEIAVNLGRAGYPMRERFLAKTTANKNLYGEGLATVFELLEVDDKIV